MAKAHKCDRCGKFYEKNQKVLECRGEKVITIGIRFVDDRFASFGHADLCDDCLDLLCDFLNMTKADTAENEE